MHRQRTSPTRRSGATAGTVLAAILAAFLVPPAAVLPAQEPPLAFSDTVSVGLVLVPVVVRGRTGYVEGLDRGDFELHVDGRPVPIESFERRADAPLSLIFLQDLSGSMGTGGKLEASREVVRFFLERAGPSDEFAMASFAGERIRVEVPFTGDRTTVAEAVDAWEAYGTTALHDAVGWLPEISAEGRKAKRAAVLLTDGADNASELSPAEAREVVRRAQLPVYVLGLGSGSPFELAGGEKVHRYADVLNLLARATGGRYQPVEGPSDLKEAVLAVAEDLRNQYVLGFTPSGVGRPAYHRIRVEVQGGKRRRVIARQGYHGTAPAAFSGGS